MPPIQPFPSWPDVSGPAIPAGAAIGGPDTPGHDDADYITRFQLQKFPNVGNVTTSHTGPGGTAR
jgi:hypothetical protein